MPPPPGTPARLWLASRRPRHAVGTFSEPSRNSLGTCLQAGAAVGATDGAGATPLHHAALAGSADVVRVLLAAGASASQGPGGATPREIALARGHAEVASILERAGGGGGGTSLAARVLLAIGAGVVACACVGWASLR